jgi:hypothetical protein
MQLLLAARALDGVLGAGAATDQAGIDWPDFRQVDLSLAVRPEDRRLWLRRTASLRPAR